MLYSKAIDGAKDCDKMKLRINFIASAAATSFSCSSWISMVAHWCSLLSCSCLSASRVGVSENKAVTSKDTEAWRVSSLNAQSVTSSPPFPHHTPPHSAWTPNVTRTLCWFCDSLVYNFTHLPARYMDILIILCTSVLMWIISPINTNYDPHANNVELLAAADNRIRDK